MTLYVNFKPIPKKSPMGMKLVKTFTDFVNFPKDDLDKEFFTNCPSNYVGKATFLIFNSIFSDISNFSSKVFIVDPKSKFLEDLLKKQKFDPTYDICISGEGWKNSEFRFLPTSKDFAPAGKLVLYGKVTGYVFETIKDFIDKTSDPEENLKRFEDYMTGKTVGIVKDKKGSDVSLFYSPDIDFFLDHIVKL